MPVTLSESPNFGFLTNHDQALALVAIRAEQYFAADPVTTLMKLRQFGEIFAQQLAARTGIYTSAQEPQTELLSRLRREGAVPREVVDLLHDLRRAGNSATHGNSGDHSLAMAALKIARQLAVFFHRTFGDHAFRPGPFQPPKAPEDAAAALQAEIERLRAEREAVLTEAERAREAAAQAEAARQAAEAKAAAEASDRSVWEVLAAEEQAARAVLAAELAILQAAAATAPASVQAALSQTALLAAEAIDIDEATTRDRIDAQLRARGWDVDSRTLRYGKGTRPTKGRSLAIAEWPTANGRADYALFVGLTCVGTVEAKRKNKNVAAFIDQAGRYSQGFIPQAGTDLPAEGPWAADSQGQEPPYRVPFLFSANSRGYLKQLETQSGIWFRDARRPTNQRRPLVDWYTPDGLLALLRQDQANAQAELKQKPFDFGFALRPYQRRAIEAVEQAIAEDGRRALLLAMATGTGKTKLAIAMLYRLLATRRFRRVCFVVDRTSLGEQAAGEFRTTRVIGANTFAETFGLKALNETTPDDATKVHICTIQSLVKRILYAEVPEDVPAVDLYDLIVVDECHRGYTLDREMGDAELSFRNEADYLSKYRRVLEHFDAVKIGLTATPALHTTKIFGSPLFTYGLREAVIDGYLIDQEPPIRIETALSVAGIHFRRGEELPLLDPRTQNIDLTTAPDNLDFEVESFNRQVLAPEFNRVVTEELASHIDPDLPGKTLVFAASDAHADMVVAELKKAFAKAYGAIDDSAVSKITGSIDKPGQMIRRFRNDELPKIAVTVDLLTTGVDVPSIVNLVFLRRVNSRILYDQMIGRATRRCDAVGKESFRVFDAVRQYDSIQSFTEMKPVVVSPNLPFAQLLRELAEATDPAFRALVRDQLLVRLQRKLPKLSPQAAEAWTSTAGEPLTATLGRLRTSSPEDLAEWVRRKPGLGPILDWVPQGGQPVPLPIFLGSDNHHSTTIGYGKAGRPEDYLSSFATFLRENGNRLAALNIVLTRPRELTRTALKELAATLSEADFTEINLRAAHRETTNQDIAAGLIGFIRQAALGDALEPWPARVERAMTRLRSREPWTTPQRQWLDRIGKQVAEMGVADPALLEEGLFAQNGGLKRLNAVFAGRLVELLSDINEEIWKPAA
jgi:type I restriction enzyme R subunit